MDELKTNKLGKVYSVFSVLFIGAMGSGLWDLFIRDFIYYAGGVFVGAMSSMYSGYFDRLFENVGGQSKALMYFPSIFIIVFVISAPLFFYMKIRIMMRRMNEKLRVGSDEIHSSKSKSFLVDLVEKKQRLVTCIIMIPLLLLSLMYVDLLIRSLTNIAAANSMERWLTIVRPYIEEKEYHLLVSEFRMVDSRLGYQLLVNKVEGYASEKSIVLPRMQVYGIETANKPIQPAANASDL